MKILLDNGMNPRLHRFLGQDHTLQLCSWLGWHQLVNGDLLRAGEQAGFEMLITTDTNMHYQQNNTKRRIAILVLPSNEWPWLWAAQEAIVAAIQQSRPGSYLRMRREPPFHA